MIPKFYNCILILLLIFYCSKNINAQLISTTDQSVNAIGLSQSGVGMINAFSMYSNSGALSFQSRNVLNANVGFYYGLPELKYLQAGGSFNLSNTDYLNLTITNFGDIDYRETTIGGGYSKRLTPKLGIGVKANYTLLNVNFFGNSSIWSFEAGALIKPTKKINVGYQTKIYATNNTIGLDAIHFHNIGIEYRPIKTARFVLSTTYNGNWSLQGGIQYHIIPKLWIKVGANTFEPSFSMGAGYRVSDQFEMDFAFRYHTILGVSPFFGASYYFGSNENKNL